ncbi:MAG: hypothetical protein RL338_1728 [Chloroflexota bacterium]
MFLRRFLGTPDGQQAGAPATDETTAVRRIVAGLEALPPDEARYLARFAYVLGRAAAADLAISPEETAVMERIVEQHGGLTEAQSVIVVEIAKTQARLHGETQDYLVTREFARDATAEQREALLRCCYLVGAADDTISASESGVISQIANELGFDSAAAGRIRAEFADRLGAIRVLRGGTEGG